MPHATEYFSESDKILLTVFLNFVSSNFSVSPIDAERSYGPIKTASNPLTCKIDSRFFTASILSIIAIKSGS